MNSFEKLKALVEGTEKDAGSFYLKGNNNVNNILM
jgi:hypothetical protein